MSGAGEEAIPAPCQRAKMAGALPYIFIEVRNNRPKPKEERK